MSIAERYTEPTHPREGSDAAFYSDHFQHEDQKGQEYASKQHNNTATTTAAATDTNERKHSRKSRHAHPHKRGAEPAPEKKLSFFGRFARGWRRATHVIIPPGGLLASAFNMASSSIGAGILGLPAATDSAGLVIAMIYLVIITCFSIYSMYLLGVAMTNTRIKSFEGMARVMFPRWHHAFSYWTAFMRWFHSFAGNVAYVISVGNCFAPIFNAAYKRNPDSGALRYLTTRSGNRLITSGVWLFIMFPLVIPKHIDSLRYASMIAILFMMYFVVIIVVHSATHGFGEHVGNVELVYRPGDDMKNDGANIYLFRTGNPVVSSVGVFMFAYVNQLAAGEIMADMPPAKRTARNLTWAAVLGMLICGILYALVCIFGYFDFGSKAISGNSLLLMYNPLEEPEVMVAYIGVLVKLCVAYAILSIAARNSIYYMIGWQKKYAEPRHKHVEELDRADAAADVVLSGEDRKPHLSTDNVQGEIDDALGDDCDFDAPKKPRASTAEAQPRLMPLEIDEDMDEATESTTFVDNIPFWKHFLVIIVLSVASLLCGLFIPKINMVFGFAGAISGGFIAFIFPSLFYMYSGGFSVQEVGWFNYLGAYALLICGVIGIVFGTGGTIYNTVAGV